MAAAEGEQQYCAEPQRSASPSVFSTKATKRLYRDVSFRRAAQAPGSGHVTKVALTRVMPALFDHNNGAGSTAISTAASGSRVISTFVVASDTLFLPALDGIDFWHSVASATLG
jgi:hypothetical protein